MKTKSAIVLAAILSLNALPGARAGFQIQDAIKAGKVIGKSAFTVHPTEKWMTVAGSLVLIQPIRDQDGSRCTFNYDRSWTGSKRFRLIVVNAPASMIAVQGKKDNRWEPDESDGPGVVRHGDIFDLGPRGRCYWTERGFNAGQILRLYPNAAIVLVEDGLDLAQLGLSQ